MPGTRPVRDQLNDDVSGSGSALAVPASGSPVDVVVLVGWSAVWVALWRLAEILAVNFGISVWYPPAAVSLFLMIRFGPLAGIAVFAASLVAGSAQWHGYPGYHEIAGSLFHTVAYLVAALLYRRETDRHRHSIRPRSILYLTVAALLGSALSSVLGNINTVVASGGVEKFAFLRLLAWGVGDFFGVMSLAPALLFVWPRLRWRGSLAALKAPLAALGVAVALAAGFALLSRSSGLDFRVLCIVGVGVYSVIVAYVASPQSAVLYLTFIALVSAGWLTTVAEPSARIEFAVQTSTFLVASLAMLYLSLDKRMASVAAANRHRRIHRLSEQRDALTRRIGEIEAGFAELAHEFKTPLGGIIGLLDVAQSGMASGGGTDQMASHLKYMRGCALYLNAMVDDAFDVSRIGRDRFEPAIADFDVASLIEDLSVIAQAKVGRTVAFPADAETDGLTVRSDRNRLFQILINLLVNAVRYADRGTSVTVACAAGPDRVTLSVENACSGVSKAQIDGYIDGAQDVAGNSLGLGIGLPLVGQLASRIGAQLETTVSDGVVTLSVSVQRAGEARPPGRDAVEQGPSSSPPAPPSSRPSGARRSGQTAH